MGRTQPPPAWTNSRTYTYADNDSNSIDMVEQRQLYDLFVFPEEQVPDYFDFWGKDKNYGRLNTEGVAIIPRESYLSQLQSADGTLFVLNFVADAWRDFTQKIRELVSEGVLYEDSPYADPIALKAWNSLETQYHDYITYDVYSRFTEGYLSLADRDRSVKNIDDFLHSYYEFAEVIVKDGGPITLAGYAESVYNSPLSSGLVIEISETAHDDDFTKGKDFIGDANFIMVARLAQQYGFLVDKNAPWRFVADIYSQAMFEYMVGVRPLYGADSPLNSRSCSEVRRNFRAASEAWGYSRMPGAEGLRRRAIGYDVYREALGVNGLRYQTQKYLKTLFGLAYREVWHQDMTRLRFYLADTYERFRTTSPFIAEPSNPKGSCPPKTKITGRTKLRRDEFSPQTGTYGYLWNLKSYYLLRRLEKNTLPTLEVRKQQIQSLVNYYSIGLGSMPPDDSYFNTLKMLQDKFLGPVEPVGPLESPNSPFNILGEAPYSRKKERKY